MNATEKLAEEIMRKSLNKELNLADIQLMIQFHWYEASKVVNNINTTSAGETDRVNRIIDFEKNWGLSKTHIL